MNKQTHLFGDNIFPNKDVCFHVFNAGFNEPCFAYWALDVPGGPSIGNFFNQLKWFETIPGFMVKAPTYDQVLDWLRREHQIDIQIMTDWAEPIIWQSCLNIKGSSDVNGYWNDFSTRNEALDDAIMKAITWIRVKKQIEKDK